MNREELIVLMESAYSEWATSEDERTPIEAYADALLPLIGVTADYPALAAEIVGNIRDGENITDAVRRDDIAETIAILHAAIQGMGK